MKNPFEQPEEQHKTKKRRGPKSSEDVAARDWWIAELMSDLMESGYTHEVSLEMVAFYFQWQIIFSGCIQKSQPPVKARSLATEMLSKTDMIRLPLSTHMIKKIYENYVGLKSNRTTNKNELRSRLSRDHVKDAINIYNEVYRDQNSFLRDFLK
jgi:hypothetical protein